MNPLRRRFLGGAIAAPFVGPAAVKAAAADLAAAGAVAVGSGLGASPSAVQVVASASSGFDVLARQRKIVARVAERLGVGEDEALAMIRAHLGARARGEYDCGEPSWARALKSPAAWWHQQQERSAQREAFETTRRWRALLDGDTETLFDW